MHKNLFMKTFITITLLAFSIIAFSQTDTSKAYVDTTKAASATNNKQTNKTPFIKKIYFGGEFGVSFGTYTTITISPLLGYRISPKLYTGIQFHYTWAKHTINTITGDKSYNYNNYGISTFLRWYMIKNLYIHIEPEFMNYQQTFLDSKGNLVSTERYWVPYVWAGAGLRKMISRRSWVSAHVLFDLVNDPDSPYKNWEPRYSVGFGTSF